MEVSKYISHRIIDGKMRLVIVDENGGVINKKPNKEELENLEYEICRRNENENKKYNDKLLDFLRSYYEKNGKIPVLEDFSNNPEYPNYGTYRNHFGSWSNALKLAGLYRQNKKYTDEELLNYLKAFYEENKIIPRMNDFVSNTGYPGYSIYQTRFGSWNNALKLVGLDKKNKIYTDGELLNYLKAFYEENKIIPRVKDFVNNPGYPSFATYQKRFGTWNKALKFVGLDIDTMVSQGILETTIQKGRLFEILVICLFENMSIDLSGDNWKSSYDGICPNGQTYDAKSMGLRTNGQWCGWPFVTTNKDKDDDKEAIQWYYFGAFSKDYTELLHVWRVPGDVVEGNSFIVGMYSGRLNVENMKEYEITDDFMKVISKVTTEKKK